MGGNVEAGDTAGDDDEPVRIGGWPRIIHARSTYYDN